MFLCPQTPLYRAFIFRPSATIFPSPWYFPPFPSPYFFSSSKKYFPSPNNSLLILLLHKRKYVPPFSSAFSFSFSMQKHFPFFLTPFVLSYAKIFSSSSFSVLLLLHPKIYSFPNICLLFSFCSILSSAKRIFFIQIFLSFSSSVFLPLRNKYIFLLQIFKCPISFVDLKWAQLYDSLVLETSEVHLQNFCPNLPSYLSTCPQISIEKWKIRKIWMWRKRSWWWFIKGSYLNSIQQIWISQGAAMVMVIFWPVSSSIRFKILEFEFCLCWFLRLFDINATIVRS